MIDSPIKLLKRMLWAGAVTIAIILVMVFYGYGLYTWIVNVTFSFYIVNCSFQYNKSRDHIPTNWREFYQVIREVTK